MIETTLTLEELILEPSGHVSGRISCPPGLIPAPGQYLSAHAPALPEPLPTSLFAAHILPGNLLLAPPLPPAWTAGMTLSLRGPLGKGFHLPALARRVALVALDVLPHRLLPLVHLALRQAAAVALYTQAIPRDLPDEVEILPLELAPESHHWADYLALDLPLSALPDLPRHLGLRPHERLACPAQALVFTAMPCSGLAECGVCAIPSGRPWKLACKDGPVLDAARLLDQG